MTGLREQKKRQTRSRLVDEAQALFERHGFEVTTIEEITAAAEVAPRTFFRYFTSKEDLVFLGQEEENALVARLLRGKPARQPALEFLLQGTRLILPSGGEVRKQAKRSRRLIAKTPALRDRQRGLLAEVEGQLARGLTPKGSSKEETLRIAVLVATYLAAVSTCMNAWLDGKVGGTAEDQLDKVARLMRSGFTG